MERTALSIAQRIDRLPMTKGMWTILMLTGIGWLFDAMDQGMVSGVVASIGSDWSLTVGQLGWLSSIGFLSLIVGAALSGMMADRFGRRTVIMWTLIIFGVGSVLCGLAQNYPMLLICRFITGFGLGGELPAASTLVSEYSPVKVRGRNVVILESFWAWGWIASALVAYLAIPALGWRAAFFIGAVPAFFAAVLRFAVPESPRYLDAVGRHREADALVSKLEAEAGMAEEAGPGGHDAPGEKVTSDIGMLKGIGALFSKEHRRATVVLWVIWFGINFGYYGFVLWMPSFFTKDFSIEESFRFTLIMSFAQLPGYFIAGLLIEKIGRRSVLTIFFAGTAFAAWLFGGVGVDSVAQIIVCGSLLYFFALGAWGCVYSYTPELYPTGIRGVGVGWAAAFGRVGAFIAPQLVPLLYSRLGEEAGFVGVFIVLTVVFLAVAAVVLLFGIETKGQAIG
ncbi:MAG: MFS transporter [Clostridiales Family XIII bacterium]|jgi:putative MFS transporter|nr:MFS transporter [Clostridiales Family XIII bacterium]